jgi:hypothetical protein
MGVAVGPVLLFGLETEITISRIVVVEPISDPAAKYSAMFDNLLLTITNARGSKRTISSFSNVIRSSELVMPSEVNVVTCAAVRPASVTMFWSIERLVRSDMC